MQRCFFCPEEAIETYWMQRMGLDGIVVSLCEASFPSNLPCFLRAGNRTFPRDILHTYRPCNAVHGPSMFQGEVEVTPSRTRQLERERE